MTPAERENVRLKMRVDSLEQRVARLEEFLQAYAALKSGLLDVPPAPEIQSGLELLIRETLTEWQSNMNAGNERTQ